MEWREGMDGLDGGLGVPVSSAAMLGLITFAAHIRMLGC